MNTILSLLPRYKIYLEHERKLAKQTVTAYMSDLRALATFAGDDVSTIKVNVLRAYMRDLSRQGMAVRTIRRKFHGFATFWRWLRMEGYVEDVITERIRLPRAEQKVPNWLNEEDLKTWFTTPAYSLRDDMAWKTLAWFGLRRSELLNLLVRDVRLTDKLLVIRKTKSKKDRTLTILDELIPGFAKLIEGKEDDDFVFKGDWGGQWSIGAFNRAFKKHVERCGLKGRITPHTLRHTFGTQLSERGTPIPTLQKLMGHQDMRSTAQYAHASPEQLRLAMSRHVLNNIKKENKK